MKASGGVKRFAKVRTGRLLIRYVITSEEVEVVLPEMMMSFSESEMSAASFTVMLILQEQEHSYTCAFTPALCYSNQIYSTMYYYYTFYRYHYITITITITIHHSPFTISHARGDKYVISDRKSLSISISTFTFILDGYGTHPCR
eukprot:scaffold4239_cov81-Skeletonema_dohrnii-CCMP3373.AAC.2